MVAQTEAGMMTSQNPGPSIDPRLISGVLHFMGIVQDKTRQLHQFQLALLLPPSR